MLDQVASPWLFTDPARPRSSAKTTEMALAPCSIFLKNQVLFTAISFINSIRSCNRRQNVKRGNEGKHGENATFAEPGTYFSIALRLIRAKQTIGTLPSYSGDAGNSVTQKLTSGPCKSFADYSNSFIF